MEISGVWLHLTALTRRFVSGPMPALPPIMKMVCPRSSGLRWILEEVLAVLVIARLAVLMIWVGIVV
jgi:hypothetical protein